MNVPKKAVYTIRKLSQEELAEIGVFISYSRKDSTECNEVIRRLKEAGVNVLSDHLIEAGTSDFHKRIMSMLEKATCGVLLYEGNLSPYVDFEIGGLEGMNKEIFVFSLGEDLPKLPDYLGRYPKIDSIEKLIETVKTKLLFSDIFENETAELSRENFLKTLLPKIGYVYLRLQIPGIRDVGFSAVRLRYLITCFYKLEKPVERDRTVCAKNKIPLESCCCDSFEEFGKCPYAEFSPAEEGETENNCEIVTVNKIYDALGIDRDDFVEYLIPVDREYGNTFKCFLDITDFTMKEKIVKLLVAANILGYNEAGAGVNDRIYFCLPPRQRDGLFEVVDERGIANNYLCPGVLE